MTHEDYKWFRKSGLLGTSRVDIYAPRSSRGVRDVTFFARDVFGCAAVTNSGDPFTKVSNLIRLLTVLCRRDRGITFNAEPRRAKLYARQLRRAGIEFQSTPDNAKGVVLFKVGGEE